MPSTNLDCPQPDLLASEPFLLSPLCGIVTECKRVHKDYCEPLLPYIYRAELANSQFIRKIENNTTQVASGKGFSDKAARISALGEAVERYSASCWQPSQIHYARRAELDGKSFDPRALVLYAEDQYPVLRYAPYSDDSTLGWVRGNTVGSEEPVWIPAIGVFLSYNARCHEEFLCPITSSGLASGQSLEDAVLKASYEVIERDAFMIWWMNRLPARRIDVADHPDPGTRELCSAYRRRGVDIELYLLPADHAVHVFMALAIDLGAAGPAVVVGLGAGLDAAAAARGAVIETAQVRPALRIRMRSPEARERLARLLADPQQVVELEDHDLLYASQVMLPRFDFVRRATLESFEWNAEPVVSAHALAQMDNAMQAIGKEVCYFDVTPADMALLGLYTARAIIPDFQPIHFGAHERRLGGRRLFQLARTLGFRDDDASLSDLNPDPHPLS